MNLSLFTPWIMHALDSIEETARLAKALSNPQNLHLDEEAFATLLDGDPTAEVIGHLFHCPSCQQNAKPILAMLNTSPLGYEDPSIYNGLFNIPELPQLAASILVLDDYTMEVQQTTGSTRIQSALQVRRRNVEMSVSLRDSMHSPSFEIGLLPSKSYQRGRFSLDVRWLKENAKGVRARVLVNGRTIAQTNLLVGSASFSDLRLVSSRIDFIREHSIIATAWIRVQKT